MLPHRLKFILNRNLTIANLLDEAVDLRPDHVLFETDEDLSRYGLDAKGITGTELRRCVNRLSGLFHDNGLRQFDRLAIWKANSLDYFLHSWAAMRLGGIAVPVNGGMPVDSLMQYLRHCGARALVTDAAGLARLTGHVPPDMLKTIIVTEPGGAPHGAMLAHARIVSLGAGFDQRPDSFDPPHMDPDQDVLICHTSGTTGFPKGVLHCSQSLILAAKGQLRVQFISSRNVAMTAAWNNHHIAISGCFTSVMAGMKVHVMSNHDAGHLLQAIARRRPNVFFAFPDVYQRMCLAGLDRHDLSSIRMWMSGGDAMHEVHIRQLVAQGAFLRVGGRKLVSSLFCELLGTSEVGMVALMKMSSQRTRRYGRCVGKRTPVSPRVKVADEIGRECPPGTVGRLMVKGPTVFKGYWNQHDRLHGVVHDGWWATGDLALRDHRGRVYQLDRDVDAVHTAQGPVYGLLVEEEALKLPGVVEAVVVATPGEGCERATLVLQVAPLYRLDPAQVLKQIRATNEYGARIDEVVLVNGDQDIPRGLTGKVLKRVLRDRLACGKAA